VSPDGSRLAVGDEEGTVSVWDVGIAQRILRLEGLVCFARRTVPGLTEHLQLPEDSEDVGGWVGTLGALLWHLQAAGGPGSVVAQWEQLPNRGHPGRVTGAAFSPDGRCLAAVAFRSPLRVWDLSTGTSVVGIEGPEVTGNRRGVAFSPDGRSLAATCHDHTAGVWQVPSGALLYSVKGHVGPLNALAFSPDARRLATAGSDGTVKLWEATTGKEVFSFDGGPVAVQSVAFGGYGERLLAARDDGAVLAWDAESARATEQPRQGAE
jgi:WD40 repeat protein